MTTVFAAVAVAAVLNYFFAGLAGDAVFNVGRAAIAFLGGWFMVSSAHRGLGMAALTGPIVLVVDHVILKGGSSFSLTISGQRRFKVRA